jgi:hypothetical protein
MQLNKESDLQTYLKAIWLSLHNQFTTENKSLKLC